MDALLVVVFTDYNNNGCTEYTGYNSSKICLIYWNRTAWWEHSGDLIWLVLTSFILQWGWKCWLWTVGQFPSPSPPSPAQTGLIIRDLLCTSHDSPRTWKELFWCNIVTRFPKNKFTLQRQARLSALASFLLDADYTFVFLQVFFSKIEKSTKIASTALLCRRCGFLKTSSSWQRRSKPVYPTVFTLKLG